MIGVVYLGKNQRTMERMRHVAGVTVSMAVAYKEAAKVCEAPAKGEHFIVFLEKGDRSEDMTSIKYLRKRCPAVYIILMTGKMTTEERAAYQKCGINDTTDIDASITEINKKIQFIAQREAALFDDMAPKTRILHFEIPLWKRAFDIVFSLLGIIILSPVFIITAIAIKIDSKGPVLFRSKRVGTNYKVFDFLKFRSMYQDADKRLMELSKEHNQYDMVDSDNKNSPAEGATDMTSEMLIGDEEVMLVGDDYVVSETAFNEQKSKENKSPFVKIENDPRVTRVGRFIRKYSIDELPQLFNILKGDMSIVGNRPLPLYEAEKLTSDDSIDRFMAPAGLTGLWQVEERGHGGMMSAEERKQLDIKYGQTYSLALDLKILFRTLTAFVQKDNV